MVSCGLVSAAECRRQPFTLLRAHRLGFLRMLSERSGCADYRKPLIGCVNTPPPRQYLPPRAENVILAAR